MQRMPALYISHGSPLSAIGDTSARRFLEGWAAALPRPRAILCLSAHWLTRAPAVSLAETPETIYDFYGFPDELYALAYPAPGAPEAARLAAQALEAAGLPCGVSDSRGLDHGAWIPLLRLYPAADIPVAQVSLQPHLGPAHAWRVGEALAPLRDQGIMIIGSGAVTHNLAEWRGGPGGGDQAPPAPWARAFTDWVAAAVERGDRDALLAYRAPGGAPAAAHAHPTDEHFLPLFSAMAAGGGRGRRVHAAIEDGSMGMDHYLFA